MTGEFVLLSAAGIVLSTPADAGFSIRRAHGPIRQIVDLSETDYTFTTSTDWVDLPNASFNLVIPAGANQLVMARFTGEAECAGPDLAFPCHLRILANNTEMLPDSGDDFAFSSIIVANGGIPLGAAADRSLQLRPGTYTIKVQYENNDDGGFFQLDDWHLNVQTADAGTSP